MTTDSSASSIFCALTLPLLSYHSLQVRLLHSNGMARGSGNEIGRSSGNPRSSVVLPSPHDANDDLSIPRGRGPVRKGDLIGRGLALIIGGPKPR